MQCQGVYRPLKLRRQNSIDLLVAGYPDFATYQELTDRRLPVAVLECVAD